MDSIKKNYSKLVEAARLHDPIVYGKLMEYSPLHWLSKGEIGSICKLIRYKTLGLGRPKILTFSNEDWANGVRSRKRFETDGCTFEITDCDGRLAHTLTDESREFQKIVFPDGWTRDQPHTVWVYYNNEVVRFDPHSTRIEIIGSSESAISAHGNTLMFRAVNSGVVHIAAVKRDGEEITFEKIIRPA